jgi:hypothetical protein
MAIIDDYAGIAAELRRIRGERAPQEQTQRPGKAVGVYVSSRGTVQVGIRPGSPLRRVVILPRRVIE